MARRVPILTYHAVLDSARPTPLAVPPARFARQMVALARAGYQSVSLARLAECLRARALDTLPERAVVLTFDDGYRSVWEAAAPILREHGFTATVFLVAGDGAALNQPPWQPPWPLLNWDEAGALAEAGHELGSHTVTHPALPLLPLAEAEREMVAAQQEIARRTGQEVSTLAYPYGAHSAPVEAAARRHFVAACGTRLALAGPGSNLFHLERVDAFYMNSANLVGRLESLPTRAYLAARRALRRLRRLARPDWRRFNSR